jgi:hypothetical protein
VPDAAADVELVEPVGVPLVGVFELAPEVPDAAVLVDEDELVAGGAGLELAAVEDGELCPLVFVDECAPARGSTYCWSPADGPAATPVAGVSMAAATAAIRQTISLRRIWSGEVLHPARYREQARRVDKCTEPRVQAPVLRAAQK